MRRLLTDAVASTSEALVPFPDSSPDPWFFRGRTLSAPEVLKDVPFMRRGQGLEKLPRATQPAGRGLHEDRFDGAARAAFVGEGGVAILHAAQFSVFENSWNFKVIKVCILLLKRVPRSRRQVSMLSLKVANLS